VDNFDGEEAIKVTLRRYYFYKAVLWLDTKTYLPLRIELPDRVVVFSNYKINKGIPSNIFEIPNVPIERETDCRFPPEGIEK